MEVAEERALRLDAERRRAHDEVTQLHDEATIADVRSEANTETSGEAARGDATAELTAAVSEVRAVITELKAVTTERTATHVPLAVEPQPIVRDLLIGDSTIKSVKQSSFIDTTVVSISGAKITDIISKLVSVTDSYRKIVLVCGGNNITANCDEANVINQLGELITEAKKHCTSVAITSICPRTDEQLQCHISSLNKKLQVICSDLTVQFINTDSMFILTNGDLNDGYMADGVHLTPRGVLKLVSYLPLTQVSATPAAVAPTHKLTPAAAAPVKATPTNVPRFSPQQADMKPRLFNGPGDILSNLAPCRIRAHGMNFCSLEQFYNYRKAKICKADHLVPEIMTKTNCWDIMRVAKQIPVVERFETMKFDIMSDCLQKKLEQSQQYRDELINTGDRRIVENTANKVWGRGDPSTYDGLNMLGQLHEIKRRALVTGKSSHSTFSKYRKSPNRYKASPPPLAPEPQHAPTQAWWQRPPAPEWSRPAWHQPPPERAQPPTPEWSEPAGHRRMQRGSGDHAVGSIPTYNRFAPLDPNEWPAAHKPVLYTENEMSDHFYDDDVLYHGY